MRVAITGTSGLVGTAVAEAFAAAGWTVTGLDRLPGRWTGIVGDLSDRRARRELLREADVVVHAAALHAPHVGRFGDEQFRAVNVDTTADLLADAAGAGRFVYISSTSVYGHALVPRGEAVWVSEALEPRPRDIYDETKLAAERLVAAAPIAAVSLRIARCFPEPLPVLASHLLHRAVFVQDVADAVLRAASRPEITGVFNVAGPYSFTREDCPALLVDAPAVVVERAPGSRRGFSRPGPSATGHDRPGLRLDGRRRLRLPAVPRRARPAVPAARVKRPAAVELAAETQRWRWAAGRWAAGCGGGSRGAQPLRRLGARGGRRAGRGHRVRAGAAFGVPQ